MCDLSNGAISDDLERILTLFSRSQHSLTLNIWQIYAAVCEIFSIKKCCDVENRVRIRSRSLEMSPFDRSHTSSYSPSIVMALSWSKIRKFM